MAEGRDLAIEAALPPENLPVAHTRFVAIDLMRGLAIGGMVLFHLDWDLADWRWVQSGPMDSWAWMTLGQSVAAVFLAVSGLCLVLARAQGSAAALRRIAVLVGTAALISLVTGWLFPNEFIFFGIIHCIAVTNLIGLAFLQAPPALTVAAAALAIAAPHILASSFFDHPAWWWLGLSTSLPATLDYRPVLPWLAPVLVGIAITGLVRRLPDIGLRSGATRGLAWAGRHSLSIYLVHQPILFGLFFLASPFVPAPKLDQHAAFRHQCRAQCIAAGAGQAGCAAACECMLDHVGRTLTTSPENHVPDHPDLETAGRVCLNSLSK